MKFGKIRIGEQRVILPLLLTVALLAGCSLLEPKPEPAAAEQSRQGSIGRYYDFDDIQVPVSMKLNKDKSMLFRAGTLKAGMLFFSDNLEGESLVNFFIDSMVRDNWSLKSSFKYPRVMLFFAKQSKTCMIQVIERTFTTEVEIWVAPAM
jgi:hypothetical protein